MKKYCSDTKKRSKKLCFAISIITFSSALSLTLHAQQVEANLLDMSLEDLMNIEVTSVSKRSQSIANAPAAIYVITEEDIKRSGVSTIPDALRMVPGLHVSRLDGNKWAVSARGFASRFANKLLVLMDGRTLYTPTFSGTYWENQDVVLQDIDRIEVIRGPGATLWGSNAVNGVINITTKSAKATQGNMVATRISSIDEEVGTWRYGGKVNEDVFYRVYGKYQQSANSESILRGEARDEIDTRRMGFRVDGNFDDASNFTFQGEAFKADIEQFRLDQMPGSPDYLQYKDDPVDEDGLNLLARWTTNQSNGGVFSTQFYYDFLDRKEQYIDETRKIYDLDIQYQLPRLGDHLIVVGGSYRWDDHKTKSTIHLSFTPNRNTDELLSFYIQDEIYFLEDRLKVVLGSKFERTGFSPDSIDTQPSARFSYQINENQSVWGAASKSLRIFSRTERDGNIRSSLLPLGIPPLLPLPIVVMSEAQGDLDPEEVMSYELGYRARIAANVTIDLALFRNEYEELRSLHYGTPVVMGGFAVLQTTYGNESDAESYGAELAFDWGVSTTWKLKGGYSFIDLDINELGGINISNQAPKHQFNLRSQHNLGSNFSLDFWYRYVDDIAESAMDDYAAFDAKLSWSPSSNFELSLVGNNLFDSHHSEFEPELLITEETEVKRSIAAEIVWSF